MIEVATFVCKMFENVQFFRICFQSLQTMLIWPQTIFCNEINLDIKNAEFFAVSNSLMPAVKNAPKNVQKRKYSKFA